MDGLVAIVTGGARGMGASEAELLVAEGATVVIADVREDEGRALADWLGAAARFVPLDVSDEASWDEAVAATMRWHGRVDALVNNAGIGMARPLVAQDLDSFERIVGINQTGVFLGMRAVAPVMAAVRAGSIVNVSSVLGQVATPMSVAYAATKFAVRGMTKVAAVELAAFGIRVNSVHPGLVATPMIDQPGGEHSSLQDIPLGRVGRPEEIARLVVFLASNDSSYCTGAEFVADGGLTAGRINDVERDWVATAVGRLLDAGHSTLSRK
jgi:3alpha(or 20beta)-hydroxysteroid dehydrogenase